MSLSARARPADSSVCSSSLLRRPSSSACVSRFASTSSDLETICTLKVSVTVRMPLVTEMMAV